MEFSSERNDVMIYSKSLIDVIEKTKLENEYIIKNDTVFHRIKLSTFMDDYKLGKLYESQSLKSSSINETTARFIIALSWINKIYKYYKNIRNHIYIVNKDTFEVKHCIYVNLFSFLYDLLEIKDNYFLKFNCEFSIYRGIFADKFNLMSFLDIDLPYISYDASPVNAFMKLLYRFHMYGNETTRQYNFLTDLEKCRQFCPELLKQKRDQTYRLQIDRYFNIFNFSSRDFRVEKFNIDNDKDMNSLLERNTSKHLSGRAKKFVDYAIFEKDVSYYIYLWMQSLSEYYSSDLSDKKDKIRTLFKSIKFLEKNKRVTALLKDNIIKYGIKFF